MSEDVGVSSKGGSVVSVNAEFDVHPLAEVTGGVAKASLSPGSGAGSDYSSAKSQEKVFGVLGAALEGEDTCSPARDTRGITKCRVELLTVPRLAPYLLALYC